MEVFNNWDVVAKGWYIACTSRSLPPRSTKSVQVCGQQLVIFRGQDQQPRALAAYCPHMGTDLSIGQVDGNLIRCFFHHWAFDGDGYCQDIPCGADIPAQAQLPAYATAEQYGFIWVYPDRQAPTPLAEFDELRGKALLVQADRAFERGCHHHICMMNGIDAQHLRTVHRLNIEMEINLQENRAGNTIDFTLRGQVPHSTWREQLTQWLLGPTYEYSMRYADGCLGLLTIMKNVRLLPPLHMIYAYTPITPGRTRIQPIYVTVKRQGLGGWLFSHFLLLLTRLAYYLLRGEDGMIYDNIQFQPKALIEIDRPIVQYMQYVNRLQPSRWSQKTPQNHQKF